MFCGVVFIQDLENQDPSWEQLLLKKQQSHGDHGEAEGNNARAGAAGRRGRLVRLPRNQNNRMPAPGRWGRQHDGHDGHDDDDDDDDDDDWWETREDSFRCYAPVLLQVLLLLFTMASSLTYYYNALVL